MKLFNWRIWLLKTLQEGLQVRDLVAYFLILLICFLLFQHGDLLHTTASSYAYLNGHFLDFYDYNKPIFEQNVYFPITYAILAIWNLPLYVFGLTTDVAKHGWLSLSIIEIVWPKLLLTLFFFATTIMTYKTAKVIANGSRDEAKLVGGLFATAPVALFAVFIFGQFDVIGLFFTMTGFYYYMRKDYSRFAWYFSVAIPFKFFALIIFVPLLLLAEKRMVQLAKYSVIALSVTVLQIVIYWESKGFRAGIFSIPSEKLSHLAELGLSPLNNAPYILVAYFIICLYSFIKVPKSDSDCWKVSILITIATYGTMFSAILWHPQWLIITTPFFALATMYIKDKEKLYVIDIIGMLAFVWIVVNYWATNVDVSILHHGAFSKYFTSIPLVNADLMPARFLPGFRTLFFVYLFSPLLVIAFQNSNREPFFDQARSSRLFRTRFILGLAVFVVPSLFCAWIPVSIALKINPLAYLSVLKSGLALNNPQMKPVNEIVSGIAVTQSFVADQDKLTVVSVYLATYARTNNALVRFALLASDGTEIATQTIDSKNLLDNAFYSFQFPAIAGSVGKTFQLRINSPDGKQGNAITAWMSEADIYPDGKLTVNGVAMPGDLMIKLYYER